MAQFFGRRSIRKPVPLTPQCTAYVYYAIMLFGIILPHTLLAHNLLPQMPWLVGDQLSAGLGKYFIAGSGYMPEISTIRNRFTVYYFARFVIYNYNLITSCVIDIPIYIYNISETTSFKGYTPSNTSIGFIYGI